MANPKVIDLDAELGITDVDDGPQHIKKIKLLGLDIRVVCDLNSFGLTNVTSGKGDSGEVMLFLESMIHPDDWQAFAHTASLHPALKGEQGAERLSAMIRRITEVASERPTKQPSDLPRGGSTRSTGRKSTARTSSTVAKA